MCETTGKLREIRSMRWLLRRPLLSAGLVLLYCVVPIGADGKMGAGRSSSSTSSPSDRAELSVQLGHSDAVYGALELDEGRILSWSSDGTLRIWQRESGRALAVLAGHTSSVYGTRLLDDGRILSWSADGTVRLWDRESGAALLVLDGHTERVNGALLLDDDRILSWSSDNTLRIWDGETGRSLALLKGHTKAVLGAMVVADRHIVSWSRAELLAWDWSSGEAIRLFEGPMPRIYRGVQVGDERLVSCTGKGTMHLWDAASGRLLAVLEGHDRFVRGVEPLDGDRAISFSNDGTLRIWDTVSGYQLAVLEGHTSAAEGAAPLDDGRILSWSGDKTLRVWDGSTGRQLALLEGHRDKVIDAVPLVDGRILSASLDKTLRIWDPDRGVELESLEGHDKPAHGKALADGRILSWSGDETLRIWDPDDGRQLTWIGGHQPQIWESTLFPNGRVLSRGNDWQARIWDGTTGETLAYLRDWRVRGARILADGRVLTWYAGGDLRISDGATGETLRVLRGHDKFVTGATELPDGRILSWGGSREVRLWDGETGESLGVLAVQDGGAGGATLLADGRILSWWSGGTIRLWDGATGGRIDLLEGHEDGVAGTDELADGRILSWSRDGTLRLWNPDTARQIAVLEGHTDDVTGAEVMPDGRILSWSRDGMLRIWEWESGESLGIVAGLPGTFEGIRGADALEDGRILSWSADGALRFWDPNTGRPISSLIGHEEPVTGASVLRDGRILSWSTRDRTIRIWDGETGDSLGVLRGHLYSLEGCAWLDDRVLLSWSRDGTHRYWDLDNYKLLATTLATADDEWAVVTPDGRFDASPGFEGLHFTVAQREVIELEQLRERFYEPNLLPKVLGRSDEALRDVDGLDEVGLWPGVEIEGPEDGGTRFTIDLTNRGGGLGRVKVRLNGAEVIGDARQTRGNRIQEHAERATLRVDLAGHPKLRPGGLNQVEVVAFNGDGSIASRGAVAHFTGSGEKSTERPDLHAVVVGVSDYEGSAIDLGYAAGDAEDFAAALSLAARPGDLFEDVHIDLLSTRPGGTLPTRRNLERAFVSLQDTRPDDVVVIFLAGHGIQSPTVEDSYLFLTADAASTGGLSDPALQERWAISSPKMREWLTQVPAGKQVLILDTCAAEAAADSLTQKRKLSGSQIRAIDRLNRATGMHILMGSAADAVSYEASRYGQGLLTYALLEGMSGAALADGGYVDVITLFGHAQKRVGDLARSIGGIQEPRIAVPGGQTFDIGQLGEEQRRRIPIEQPRPMISRPNFLNESELEDDLDLSDTLAEVLAERMYAPARGTEPVVFVDAKDVAGGCPPTGLYRVEGGKITVDLKLKRDDEEVLTKQFVGSIGRLGELVEGMVNEIVMACPTQ
jgi:WD40 repeat protein